MKQFEAEWRKLNRQGEHVAALELALHPPFDENKISPGDDANLAALRGHCYAAVKDRERAYAQYQKAILSNKLTDHMLCNTLLHRGIVETYLQDYDMSLATCKQALSYCCTVCETCTRDRVTLVKKISDLEIWTTWSGYGSPFDGEKNRICHHCRRVAIETDFVLCGCKHVRYCNDECKAADAIVHEEAWFHMILERLPPNIFRQHILSLCILPRETDLRAWIGTPKHQQLVQLRRHALSLRTLSRWWKKQVDQCRRFWLDVIPFDWQDIYKPNPNVQGKYMMDELRTYILQWAIYNGEHDLKTKRNALTKEITKLTKATDKLRTSLKEKETKKTTAEKELEGVEGRLKRMKK